ncbi:hypothetical protein VIBHAR_02047 [Vibrio campbellii ATCC BAA-1116]|uniref:Uncharacterized protein n=1 Tax=Vibrio campbellii (strain ATCC BAA-1116) TaxID=2902295 RepID=A7MVL9_VIBC1|nr:hypothetical protein VIBHAR_02047 [Vibrio campbellii ATCC BAA-1116]
MDKSSPFVVGTTSGELDTFEPEKIVKPTTITPDSNTNEYRK